MQNYMFFYGRDARCFAVARYTFLSFLIVSSFASSALSDSTFECVASVSYSWSYTPPISPEVDKKKSPKQKVTDESQSKESQFSVAFSTRHVQDVTEESAKKKLRGVLDKDLVDARAECTRLHENLSGCVSTKFQSMGPVIRQLDFSSRKTLEQSVQIDCQKQTGRCLEAKASEIACQEIVLTPVVEEEKSEKSEKADKKKKK